MQMQGGTEVLRRVSGQTLRHSCGAVKTKVWADPHVVQQGDSEWAAASLPRRRHLPLASERGTSPSMAA